MPDGSLQPRHGRAPATTSSAAIGCRRTSSATTSTARPSRASSAGSRPVKTEGLTQLRNVYPLSEFIQLDRSAVPPGRHDDRARRHDVHHRHVSRHHPGARVVADRARTCAQQIEQYQLDKVIGHGRIWRLDTTGMRRATRDAAADAQRDAGAARRASRASERLVARHGAAAARAEAGQVGRAGAADAGRARRDEPARAVPCAVDARRARRARRRARRAS